MMNQAIKDFPKQFSYAPRTFFGKLPKRYTHTIVAGMGGSHLAADLLKSFDPTLSLTIHKDYGLPFVKPRDKKDTLLIASSYSGNTEETIDALKCAQKQGIDCAAISVGGELKKRASRFHIPYVELPRTGIQPRSALGLSLKALLHLMKKKNLLLEVSHLAHTLNAARLETAGKKLALSLRRFVPIIYTSLANEAIGYNWKIKFNETGKIPAFYNVLPELNHNEMTGFDVIAKTKKLSAPFHFLFLTDPSDHPRTAKRMDVLKRLYRARDLPVTTLGLRGTSRWEMIFSSLLLADWTAYHTAQVYGAEPEHVPMVEEFKKLVLER